MLKELASRGVTVDGYVWMITRLEPRPGVLWYPPASNAEDAWKAAVEDRRFGFCQTKDQLMRQGWRARRVSLTILSTPVQSFKRGWK